MKSGATVLVLLGHAYPSVVRAVQEQAGRGTSLTMNHPLELETPELLSEMVPCAEMVRFCKGGGEADMVAIRIARAATGRDRVRYCGYHGWHHWSATAGSATLTGIFSKSPWHLPAITVSKGDRASENVDAVLFSLGVPVVVFVELRSKGKFRDPFGPCCFLDASQGEACHTRLVARRLGLAGSLGRV